MLEYLNYSMILNKYELRKHVQNEQRNMMHPNYAVSSSTRPSSSSKAQTSGRCCKPPPLVHQVYSSGYNSENHSNSSQCTTTPTAAGQSCARHQDDYCALFNLYRLTLSHLPSNFHHTLTCTCTAGGETATQRKSSPSPSSSCKANPNTSEEVSSPVARQLAPPPPSSSSPITPPPAPATPHDDDELLDVDDDEDFDVDDDEDMDEPDEQHGRHPAANSTHSNGGGDLAPAAPTAKSEPSNVTVTRSVVTSQHGLMSVCRIRTRGAKSSSSSAPPASVERPARRAARTLPGSTLGACARSRTCRRRRSCTR